MISSMKIEKQMEFELIGISGVKLIAKNIVLGSPGTNAKLFLQCDVFF